MSRDIVMAMITVDRTPKENYVFTTIENMVRGGLLTSERLAHVVIRNSSPAITWLMPRLTSIIGPGVIEARTPTIVTYSVSQCLGTENLAETLLLASRVAMEDAAKWVLICEDDLDVCADFFGSVGRWLDRHENKYHRLYAFGAAYAQVSHPHSLARGEWHYPVGAFYGSQCFALRTEDARSLGTYLMRLVSEPEHCEEWLKAKHPDWVLGPGFFPYDLVMQDWSRDTYPNLEYFLASAPCFVQHIGRQSVCTEKETTHEFVSWPGREWSYR